MTTSRWSSQHSLTPWNSNWWLSVCDHTLQKTSVWASVFARLPFVRPHSLTFNPGAFPQQCPGADVDSDTHTHTWRLRLISVDKHWTHNIPIIDDCMACSMWQCGFVVAVCVCVFKWHVPRDVLWVFVAGESCWFGSKGWCTTRRTAEKTEDVDV